MSIPNKIFIIPYRNRELHKHHFEIYMKYILEDIPEEEYKIYFIHQSDARPFNRGAMKNIGFLVMKKLYPNNYKNITFIFNDIDTMPVKKNLINYDTKLGEIKHFFGFDFALGGFFSIKGADFEKIGGFPNFWGWGFEDNIINNRAVDSGIKINRDVFFKIGDNNIIHLVDNLNKILSKQDVWRHKLKIADDLYSIRELKYNINNEFINITSFTSKFDYKKDTMYYANTTNISKIPAEPKYGPPNYRGNNRSFLKMSYR